MKKIYSIAIVAVAFLSFASCKKETLIYENQQLASRTIIATFENADTKTSPSTNGDKTTPMWAEGDQIKVFNSSNFEVVTLPSGFVSSSTFTFTTSLTGDLYAVYPASATEMTSCSGSVTFTIPPIQDGGFASANICVAKSSGNNLTFSNATAVLEFDAGQTGVECVRVRSTNAIVGSLTVSFGTDNRIDNSSYVTTGLTNRTITAGSAGYAESKLYVAVAPVATGAIGFKYYKDIDNVARLDDGTGKTMVRNKIYTFALPSDANAYTKDYELVDGLKWATQNVTVSTSGQKPWKGDNADAVKVPGTIYPVVVGDYFQWGAYAGYCGQTTDSDKGLLIYQSFVNAGCGDADDQFTFKSAGDGKEYWFYVLDGTSYKAISPYLAQGFWKSTQHEGYYEAFGMYNRYSNNATGTCDYSTLLPDDDVAYVKYGGRWRMPMSGEFVSLQTASYWAWDAADCGYYIFCPTGTHQAGGIAYDSVPSDLDKRDALLFFPAAGYADTDVYPWSESYPGGGTPDLVDVGLFGDYWSSSLSQSTFTHESKGYQYSAYGLDFSPSDGVVTECPLNRYLGCSIRPVNVPTQE